MGRMSYWDNRQSAFQVLIGSMGLLFLGLTIFNFIAHTTTITDENLFEYPRPQFITQKRILALKEEDVLDKKKFVVDTIDCGFIINSVDETPLKDYDQFCSYQDTEDLDNEYKTEIFNTKTFKPEQWIIRSSDLVDKNVLYAPLAALIIDVFKGGASDEAGLKRGDIIIKVNNQGFDGDYLEDLYKNKLEDKSSIDFEVIRGSERLSFTVNVSKYGIKIVDLLHFLLGLSFMSVGLFLGLKRPNLVAARLTGLSLLFLGISLGFGSIGMRIGTDLLAQMRFLALLGGIYFGLSTILHSSYYFPNEFRPILSKKWIIWTPYILATAIFTLAIIDYYTMSLNLITMLYYCFVGLMLVFFYSVRYTFRRYRTPETKKQSIILRLAFYLILIPYLTNIYLISVHKTDLGYYHLFLTFTLPLAYLITISRYKLLDLNIKIKRNIQYFFVSIFWKIFIVSILILTVYGVVLIEIPLPNLHFTGTSIEVLEKAMRPELVTIYSKVIAIILAFAASLLILKLDKKGQHYVDKIFNRTEFDYRTATDKFRNILSTRLSIEELSKAIVERLSDLFNIKQGGILFFKDEDKLLGQKYFGVNDSSLKEYCFLASQKIIHAVKQFNGGFKVDYLPISIKEVFQECKFQYVIPIRSKGKVTGALLIGEKKSESAFYSTDIEYFTSIASQVSIAVENLYLYEDLANQERMKIELDFARRIQLASLPQSDPKIAGLEISAVSLPALEVGGDFYEFLNGTQDEITIVIGDVSGKGTSAALYMSKAQGIIKTLHNFDLSPKDLLIKTNALMYDYLSKSSFITAIGAKFNTVKKELKISRAGHLPLYIYRHSTREVERVITQGMVIGLDKSGLFDSNLEERTIKYAIGDVFLFVTDGVVEARNEENVEFEETRLLNIFTSKAFNDPVTIRNNIVNEVQEFAGKEKQFDDITVVVVKAN